MKKVELYQCELCSALYPDETDAKLCESKHATVKRVKSAVYTKYDSPQYNAGLPEEIIVEFNNGWFARYVVGK